MADLFIDELHRRSLLDVELNSNLKINRCLILEFLKSGIRVNFAEYFQYFDNVHKFQHFGQNFHPGFLKINQSTPPIKFIYLFVVGHYTSFSKYRKLIQF